MYHILKKPLKYTEVAGTNSVHSHLWAKMYIGIAIPYPLAPASARLDVPTVAHKYFITLDLRCTCKHIILLRVNSYKHAQDPIHNFIPGLFSLSSLTAAALALAKLGLFGSVASVDADSRALAGRGLVAVGRRHAAVATASRNSVGQSSPIFEGTLSIRRSCNRK